MLALRTLSSSVTISRVAVMGSRSLSTQTTQAVEKLKTVLEGYRLANYQQELPTRFKKDIAKAAVVHHDRVAAEGVERVLTNIGAETRINKEDLHLIFAEVGEGGEISAQRFIDMI